MNLAFHCFSRQNQYYAIDTFRLVPVKISQDTYNFLKNLSDGDITADLCTLKSNEKYKELYLLAQNNILLHSLQPSITENFRELNLSFTPVLSCNMNCTYCYSGKNKNSDYLSSKTVLDALTFFINNYVFSTCRIDFVGGGEPLFSPPHLFSLVNLIKEKMNDNGKKTIFWLCTNGINLSRKIRSQLDEYNINIGISLDGPRHINDVFRVDHRGVGTYTTVKKNVNSFLEDPSLSRNIKNLWNSAVITSATTSLIDIIENSYALGFRNLQMKLVWGGDSLFSLDPDIVINLYEELTNYLHKLIVDNQIEKFLMICNENDTYGKIFTRILLQSGTVRRCNAGINKFSISAQGLIFPCDSFLGIKTVCLGDIYSGFNNTYFQFAKMNNTTIERCSKCWAKNICGGDCFYNSLITTRSLTLPNQEYCLIIKAIIEMIVELIISLYTSNPDKMHYLYSILSKKMRRKGL